jgi:hypothetical protein
MALVQFGSDFPIPALQRELERFLGNPAISLGLSGQGAYPPINVSAKYENGLLVIRVPKAESAKPRQITIQAG